ncbi:O-methyltransferase [Paenibacillus sinopodophylli]|uniref:O-methyltransferase n=1 Tax=Paenibacillus sinopodophylli TaxID=1837342 RepID=UPI00110CA361|nr:class I SAM-dependent methyltransferase [Paenibacillus sinopodophylli]
MLHNKNSREPAAIEAINREADALGFNMSCDTETGSLLRTLAASCPKGRLLELGTGAGVSTSWILDGMCKESVLLSVESDESVQGIAQKHLGGDERLRLFVMDGADLIQELEAGSFDFIFADTWPGKFHALEEALALLKPGGLYIIDDLIPIPSWSEGHPAKVDTLIRSLDSREDLQLTKLDWSTGIIIVTKKH